MTGSHDAMAHVSAVDAPSGRPGASRIAAVSYHVPEEVLPSAALEAEFGLPPGQVEALTGIRARRIARTAQPSDLALVAAQRCLAAAGCAAESLDVLIYAGLSRDFVEPATANVLQARLGARQAVCFDLTNACLGLLNGMLVADGLIGAGRVRRVLIAAAESGLELLDMPRPAAAAAARGPLDVVLTLGHGAAAVLLEPASAGPGHRILDMEFRSFGEFWELCTWRGPGAPLVTRMHELERAGVACLIPAARQLLRRVGWWPDGPDVVIPHQTGRGGVRRALAACGFPRVRVYTAFEDWGNIASATVAASLARAVEDGAVRPGDRVVLGGMGSGINVGLVALDW